MNRELCTAGTRTVSSRSRLMPQVGRCIQLLTYNYVKKQSTRSFSNARVVMQLPEYGCPSFHVNLKKIRKSAAQREVPRTKCGWLFIRFQLANYVTRLYTCLEPFSFYLCLEPLLKLNAVQVLGLWLLVHLRKHFLDLGLAVTEINTKKVQKQENKNIKNVKRCRDGMPKTMQTRQG